MNKKTKHIVTTSLFAAFVCVSTMVIRIPTPSTGGYIHPGDALVIMSGIMLGPYYGFLAASIGSAMADLIGGYFIYIPITFVIKGLIAYLAGTCFKKMDKTKRSRYTAVIIGGIIDILLVSMGYLLCESFLYGFAGALTSVPANVIQGISGMILSMVLYPILFSIKEIRQSRIK